MEAPMKSRWDAWRNIALAVCCLVAAAETGYAQKQTPTSSAQAARSVLSDKARALEARGRPDLALQLWQQILLSEPKNTDALAGAARDYKVLGDAQKSSELLGRLRAVNPGDPNIARIESMANLPQSDQLKQAGALAKQNRPEEAIRIYRQLYGDHPPEGDVAVAYYQTLYATRSGKAEAVAGMRSLVAKNPGIPEYAIALGTLLTYDARTRAEGLRILQAHAQNPGAQSAIRQAIIWNAANSYTAGQLRDYLKAHPQDQEIAALLKQAETRLAQSNTGIARTPEERAAFAALNAGQLEDASNRFAALLSKDPNNGRLLAGMGFLRMRQQDFSGAVSYLEQAQLNGYTDKTAQDALADSRFWLAMADAAKAVSGNQYALAESNYRQALTMKPLSPEALSGLAGLLMRKEQYAQAADVYEQLLGVRSNDAEAWRGLFLSYARAGQNDKALAAFTRIPAATQTALSNDLDFLRTLAAAYQAQSQSAEAERILVRAIALPVPESSANLQLDTRLQYAGLLLGARRYSEAATQYTQILNLNPSNLGAWEGLIAARHSLGQDTEAIEDMKRMPAAVYETALADPGFLAQLGAIYQQANQFDVAQGLLERAEKQAAAAGSHPGIDLQMQLAAIYMLRSEPDRAYEIYRQAVAANPNDPKAWQGVVTSLHSANHDAQALQQIALIPAGIRKQLETNIDFMQVEASIYAAVGDVAHAQQYLQAVKNYYARSGQQVPPDVDVQNAWLLYNIGDDRSLYDALMRLGGRMDLSAPQREMVENIWANWSVRRANAAIENGDISRAVDILDAARLAFPANLTVSKAVAGGYVVAGRSKEALAIFKTIPLQNAGSADFQGAIGAALAANDKAQAEIWLRQALDRFPRDPAILNLAAQYEQSRGDNERAADYYRAAIAAMPKVSPTDRLAHALVNPDADTRPHKAVTAADLERLLNPENEPFSRTVKLPPLPAYGPDPYNGTAPVNQPAAPTTPASQQLRPAVDSKPVIVPIPSGALSSPAFFGAPIAVYSGGTGAAQLGAPSSQPESHAPALSLAAQNWKGLLSTLAASGRNAEALQELNRIPDEVRSELERDIEFQQTVAALYVALGDIRRAQPYLTSIENYFFVNRDHAPGGLALQHAWLLNILQNDAALYGALLHLDQRSDLTQAQQTDVRRLWGILAVRRANYALDRGNLQYGVQILQAATQDFPADMGIRRTMAGAYARIGRPGDAVALYKSIPMTAANAADLEASIAAALAVGDMAQAEAWLRQALTGFPHDAEILSYAAHFEQMRGNTQRGTEFLQAAGNVTLPGSTVRLQQSIVAYPPGTFRAPASGTTRYLLNPALAAQVAALSEPQPQATYIAPLRPAQWVTQPSRNPLPLVATPSNPEYASGSGQGTAPGSQPYTGRVMLPPDEENVASIPDGTPDGSVAADGQQPVVRPALPAGLSNPADILRSQPPPAKEAKTDAVHALPNAPVQPMQSAGTDSAGKLAEAQYTPSAQEATTGAYSAPNRGTPQTPQPVAQPEVQPQAAPAQKPRSGATMAPARRAAAIAQTTQQPQPTTPQPQAVPAPLPAAPLQSAPAAATPQQQTPSSSTGTGLTDQELQDRNLPPLRGPWVRTQRQAPQLNPRDVAEQQLQKIESSYSGWLGGTATSAFRSGNLGYSRLVTLEAPFETSSPMGYQARFSLVPRPVFLDSGQADGSAVRSVQITTAAGRQRAAIPDPMGTLTGTDANPPAQQNAMGVGGDLQLAFPRFAIAGGYTPYGFLVSTFTARMMWKPADGPVIVTASRDSVKDSQLSYAGLRDPAFGSNGPKWGGVVANQGALQFNHGDAQSGFYFAVGGQYLTGYNVRKNTRIDGTGGAYWRAYSAPEYGTLNIGANFFAMHYGNNQNAFTFGMGGYFSPQIYFLANVPFTWTGHYQTRWHYNITGGVGVQAFQENATPLWPLYAQRALQAATGNPMLPDFTSVGGNYDLHSQAAYQITPHLFAGGYLQANNTRNYNYASVGFYVRYIFREQPSAVAAPTGLFPADGLRPFNVP
jgi:tetratricopeptide (TPR) repeat protein